jgi:hypothetical protein
MARGGRRRSVSAAPLSTCGSKPSTSSFMMHAASATIWSSVSVDAGTL